MNQISNKFECWAASLGDCEGKLSREHLISQALFPTKELITVSGFPWCNGEEKKVSITGLTSKILCEKHNNDLSSLDATAADAFKMFEKGANLTNTRARASPPFKVHHFHIDGHLFERWLLKTLINLCVTYQDSFFIGASDVLGKPSKELVEMCYGKATFPGKSGMYVTTKVGRSMKIGPSVKFCPLFYDETHVAGGFFHFRGFQIFLSLLDEELQNFDWISDADNIREWSGTVPSWHFKKITTTVGSVPSFIFHFDW